VEVILGLAALIGLAWGWLWITGKVREKANQNIFSRTAHRQGQELTESILRAEVSADLKTVQDAIIAQVVTVATPPLVISDIYLDSVAPGRIEYVCGTKLQTAFRAVVTLRETDGRVVVEQMFSHWMTLDGVVAPVSTMQRLRTDLERGLHTVDHRAVVNIVGSNALGRP
jgi:hypothetical protein